MKQDRSTAIRPCNGPAVKETRCPSTVSPCPHASPRVLVSAGLGCTCGHGKAVNHMKMCKTCKVSKPISEYGAHKGNADGYSVHCKECIRAKDRARRPAQIQPTRDERFWSHVDRSGGTSACWIWTGCVGAWGYGSFQRWLAHRFSYMLAYGVELTPDQCVCHSCDTPRCVNPAHLWVGTPKQNTDDCIAKGRFAVGEKRKSAKLTEAQVSEIKKARANGLGRKRVAAAFGVHPATIQLIDNGRNWKHVK